MKGLSRLRLLLVLGCVAGSFAGCSHDPNVRKQKYFESGERYFEKAKYREAVIQYRNATEVDGSFASAHFKLAESYMKLQDWQRAYVELTKTVELQPDNYKARLELTNILIAAGQPDQLKSAQDQVDVLKEKQPNDPDTHVAQASILAREQRFNEAIAEMQKALALEPSRGEAYYNIATLQAQMNLPELAEANYKKAIELKATGANPRLALAGFYQSHRRFAEAEQQIQLAMTADSKDVEARAAMARLYASEGKRTEAESFLRQAGFPRQLGWLSHARRFLFRHRGLRQSRRRIRSALPGSRERPGCPEELCATPDP
jgi:Tfp pilus assembly protein PilF